MPLMSGIRMSRMIACGWIGVGQLRGPTAGSSAVATSKPLELQHPREGVGDRPVVVHDEDGCSTPGSAALLAAAKSR